MLNKRSEINLRRQSSLHDSRGQIVVEYVLLLAIAVALAAIVTKTLVGHSDKGSSGFVITTWQGVLQTIGADHADDIQR